MGRKLKVEEIRDDGRMGRVRVPEKIVAYVVGEAKRFSGSKKNRRATNTLRRIERLEQKSVNAKSSKKVSNGNENSKTKKKKEAAKRPPRLVLAPSEQEEMDRAVRRGYISLEGSSTKGYTRRRCSQSRLAAAHRQWCDDHGLPHIVHCKANSNSRDKFWGDGKLLDWIIVDLSPLRIHTDSSGSSSSSSDAGTGIATMSQNNINFDVNDFLVRWKAEIATAAAMSGMELRRQTIKQGNYELLSALDEDDDDKDVHLMNDNQGGDDDDDDEECMLLSTGSCHDDDYADDEESSIGFNNEDVADYAVESVLELSDNDSWSTAPISSLPFLTMGIFEGERSQAKAMAKELAQLWGTTESSLVDDDDDDDNDVDSNTEMDDLLDARFPHEQYKPALSHHSPKASDRRKHNGRNSSNGPSKKRRVSENRRRRRNFNSRDIDMHMMF